MEWWLVVVAAVMAVITVALVFYLVVLFSSEDDKNQAWFPKIVVVLSLSLACFNVLILPYDIANRMDPALQGTPGGGIDVTLVWQIVLYAIAALTFVICPFAMFYYESRDVEQEDMCHQIRPAALYTLVSLGVFCGLLFLLWLTLGTAAIPFNKYTGNYTSVDSYSSPPSTYEATYVSGTLDIKVSLFVYLVGLMSAVGWVLFFIFGGVGLTAMPMDFINAYRDRPIPITAAEYAQKKVEIARETERLMEEGKKLDEANRSGKSGKKHNKKVLAFKNQVNDLEQYYEKVEISYKEKGGEILKAWIALAVGIVSTGLSIAWFFHIILFNIANATPFLNALFIALDKAFSLLGVLAYAIFAFYLLWCVVKGCTRVGVNLLLFTVYPMKVNGTLMNAFLFNCILIMLTSVSVIQFCAISFKNYAANTSVSTLFTTYVSRLVGVNYVVMYLQYPLVAVSFLALLWLCICPRRKVSDNDDDDD
jgi:LMBR1 domain-containing protein 1